MLATKTLVDFVQLEVNLKLRSESYLEYFFFVDMFATPIFCWVYIPTVDTFWWQILAFLTIFVITRLFATFWI